MEICKNNNKIYDNRTHITYIFKIAKITNLKTDYRLPNLQYVRKMYYELVFSKKICHPMQFLNLWTEKKCKILKLEDQELHKMFLITKSIYLKSTQLERYFKSLKKHESYHKSGINLC